MGPLMNRLVAATGIEEGTKGAMMGNLGGAQDVAGAAVAAGDGV